MTDQQHEKQRLSLELKQKLSEIQFLDRKIQVHYPQYKETEELAKKLKELHSRVAKAHTLAIKLQNYGIKSKGRSSRSKQPS